MAKYRSPLKAKGSMTTPFKKVGSWRAGYHTGEDWVCSDRNLVSPTSGVVSFVGYDSNGYGNYLIIHTDDKKTILMAHFAKVPSVKKGEKVKSGQAVGTMGTTGNSTGVHLHIEVQNASEWNYNENLLKPSDYIDFDEFKGDRDNMAEFKMGDSNNGVFAAKILLMQLKREGVITQGVDANGVFGGGTLIAVKQVQKKAGLQQSGVIDTATLRAMNSLLQKAESSDAAIQKERDTLKDKIKRALAIFK